MTPKNKKKIRKQIADSRVKKHTSPERRIPKDRYTDNDEQRERKFSRDDRFFDRSEKREYRKKEENFEREDRRKNYRPEDTQNRRFDGKKSYEKNREKKLEDRKPYERNERRKFDDRKNQHGRKTDKRFETERKPYDRRTSENADSGKRTFDKKGGNRFTDRYAGRKNFDDRKPLSKNFRNNRYDDSREYIKKVNFEEDRNSRFIDEESPLKKNRTTGDNRKYSSYEQETGKTKKNRPTHIDEMRLNKYLAHCGIAARRKADELIAGGAVKVNGKIVREMGYKVMPGDEVRFKGKLITPEEKVYILINKPKDFITTAEDERGRKTILQLIEGATDERVYPVGRLDRNTTGVLLLTNDGEMAQQLSHPSFGVKKVYAVELDKPLAPQHMKRIEEGIELEDGVAMVDDIAYADAKNYKIIGIMLHVGKNRIVRRIFEHLGYEVLKLDRTLYAGLDKKNLDRGRWRFLTEKEITMLKRLK